MSMIEKSKYSMLEKLNSIIIIVMKKIIVIYSKNGVIGRLASEYNLENSALFLCT